MNWKIWGFVLLIGTAVLGAFILIQTFYLNNETKENENNIDIINDETEEIEENTNESEEPNSYESAFDFSVISATTGLPLSDINNSGHHFMVVIENSVNARPQTGLVNADIVFEMEVEGTTTRFLAIFNNDIPERIGPVRSARHYFLPIAEHWNTEFYHYGKSQFAKPLLGEMSVDHFDGTRSGYSLYKRDEKRKAPHNAYLIIDRIQKNDKGATNTFFGFSEAPETPANNAVSLAVRYNSLTNIEYIFDGNEKKYIRKLQGEDHIDNDTGETIKVDNVVIMLAKHESMGTKQGHIDIDFEGGGKIYYAFNGGEDIGSWKYSAGEINFLNKDGEPLVLKQGKTWIQVVDEKKEDQIEITSIYGNN